MYTSTMYISHIPTTTMCVECFPEFLPNKWYPVHVIIHLD